MHDVASGITIPAGGELSVGEGNFKPNISHSFYYYLVMRIIHFSSSNKNFDKSEQTQHMGL